MKKLSVDELPAVVGWLSNGEKQILKMGIHVKDMKSTIRDLSSLLDGFEKKNKKIISTQSKKTHADSDKDKEVVPLLTATNFDAICGEKTPVCIIGIFRSFKGREKLHTILSSVSYIVLCSLKSLNVLLKTVKFLLFLLCLEYNKLKCKCIQLDGLWVRVERDSYGTCWDGFG